MYLVQVAEEFYSIHPLCTVNLRDVWPRSRILERASEAADLNTDLRLLLSGLQDEWNEGAEMCTYFFLQNTIEYNQL